MTLKARGQEIDCIELYPMTADSGHVGGFTFSLVSRSGRTVVTDRVLRRDHQTVLGLLQETASMVRHCCEDGG